MNDELYSMYIYMYSKDSQLVGEPNGGVAPVGDIIYTIYTQTTQ